MTENREQKSELRRTMRERLASKARNTNSAIALRDRFLAEIKLPPGAIIAGTIAQDHEIDPAPLMEALHARGYKLALPCITAKDGELLFRAYQPKDVLITGRFNIPEPSGDAAKVEPDIVFVPLLAYTRDGHRLGRGGGYYDRALQTLRKKRKITAIGLGYADQQLSAIPFDSHDARLDKIITELEVITILNPY